MLSWWSMQAWMSTTRPTSILARGMGIWKLMSERSILALQHARECNAVLLGAATAEVAQPGMCAATTTRQISVARHVVHRCHWFATRAPSAISKSIGKSTQHATAIRGSTTEPWTFVMVV
jgi:hypothetical protein